MMTHSKHYSTKYSILEGTLSPTRLIVGTLTKRRLWETLGNVGIYITDTDKINRMIALGFGGSQVVKVNGLVYDD